MRISGQILHVTLLCCYGKVTAQEFGPAFVKSFSPVTQRREIPVTDFGCFCFSAAVSERLDELSHCQVMCCCSFRRFY